MFKLLTTFYVSGSTDSIKTQMMNIMPRGRPKRLGTTEYETRNPHLISGLTSWTKSNSKYSQLIKYLNLNLSVYSQLFETYCENIGIKQDYNLRAEDVEMVLEEHLNESPNQYFAENMIWEIVYLCALKNDHLHLFVQYLALMTKNCKTYFERFK